MQGSRHKPQIIASVRAYIKEGQSYTQVGKLLGMSRNQVAGIVDRHIEFENRPGQSIKKIEEKKRAEKRLLPGSLGVIERQINDRSRITLIAIPSLGELVPKAYSYISRDQTIGR